MFVELFVISIIYFLETYTFQTFYTSLSSLPNVDPEDYDEQLQKYIEYQINFIINQNMNVLVYIRIAHRIELYMFYISSIAVPLSFIIPNSERRNLIYNITTSGGIMDIL